MESKTKQRVLGFSVIVGVLVLMYVFFQPGKDNTETTIVKAPPFPEQSVQITEPLIQEANSTSQSSAEQGEIIANAAESGLTSKDQISEAEDKIKTIRPSVISEEVPNELIEKPTSSSSEPEIITNSYSNETIKDNGISHLTMSDTKETTVPPNTLQEVKEKKINQIHQSKKSKVSQKKANKPQQGPTQNNQTVALEDDGLFKLTNAAWVIQIGSFQNKTNALKLVNQLRAKGFKAFIQQVSTTIGDSTRVFVGPETKHGNARVVANRLEKEMHIRGIVISYKPLTL